MKYNHLEFRIEPYYDEDLEKEFEQANIYVDGESLAILLQVHAGNVPLPSEDLDENEAFLEFSGQSPENLLLHLLNWRYGHYPNNDNMAGNTLLLNCFCGVPFCSSIYCEIVDNTNEVIWQNFYNYTSPKEYKYEKFSSFRFTKKNYEEQLQILKNWVNENRVWQDGDVEENLPPYE